MTALHLAIWDHRKLGEWQRSQKKLLSVEAFAPVFVASFVILELKWLSDKAALKFTSRATVWSPGATENFKFQRSSGGNQPTLTAP